jgi:hypothetical protein
MKQLNNNVKAYVDDVVVKTQNSDTLITDFEETFTSLREYQWKSTPTSASLAYLQGNYSASPSATMTSKLRTMCGSRTGGWSLPYVMSD